MAGPWRVWCRQKARPRKPGLLDGQGYWMAEDFDDPLPDDLLDLFEGKRKERGTEEP